MNLQAQVATLKAQQEQENFPFPNQTINGGSTSSVIHSPPFSGDDFNNNYNNLLLDSNFMQSMQQLNQNSAAVDMSTCIEEGLVYRDGVGELQSDAYGYFQGQ
jgi:hypothetical protein